MQEITENIYVLVTLVMGGTFLLAVSFLLIHANNQNKILKQQQVIQQSELQHQKEIMGAIYASQEEERKRIGSDLHDSVGAALSSLRMVIESMPESAGTGLRSQCKEIIDRIIVDTRNISHNLSPVTLNLYGLPEAIEDLADVINNGGQFQVNIENQADESLAKLSRSTELSIYRILEELFNNTIKHSGGNQIAIRIWEEGNRLQLSYSDNGKGLKDLNNSKGMGMANIKNRLDVINATYTFSAPNEFRFNITCSIPIQ